MHINMNQGRFADHDIARRDEADQLLAAGFALLQGADGRVEFVGRNVHHDGIFIGNAQIPANHGVGLLHGPAQFFPRRLAVLAAAEHDAGQDFPYAEHDGSLADISHRFIEDTDALVEHLDSADHAFLRFFQYGQVMLRRIPVRYGLVFILQGFIHGDLYDRQLTGLVVPSCLSLLQIKLRQPDFLVFPVQLLLLQLQQVFVRGDEAVLFIQFFPQIAGLLQQLVALRFQRFVLHPELPHSKQGDAHVF